MYGLRIARSLVFFYRWENYKMNQGISTLLRATHAVSFTTSSAGINGPRSNRDEALDFLAFIHISLNIWNNFAGYLCLSLNIKLLLNRRKSSKRPLWVYIKAPTPTTPAKVLCKWRQYAGATFCSTKTKMTRSMTCIIVLPNSRPIPGISLSVPMITHLCSVSLKEQYCGPIR